MPSHAVGPNDHQRPDGIKRGALELSICQASPEVLRFELVCVWSRSRLCRPAPIECGKDLAIAIASVPSPPRGMLCNLHPRLVVFQALKELLPFRIDRLRVLQETFVELFDELCIAAPQERRPFESCVEISSGHCISSKALNQRTCFSVCAICAGESATLIPARCRASTFDCASPLPPEMM